MTATISFQGFLSWNCDPIRRKRCRRCSTYWRSGGGNPLLAKATGTGKSVVIAFLIKQLLSDYPEMRVLVTAPNRELIDQDVKELRKVWPDAPIGINCEGLGLSRHRHANSVCHRQFDLSQPESDRPARADHHR